jgi:glycosyltransferase involved in cell wall biosynthesis
MTTEPNLDAAVFFVRDVFPLIRQCIPDAQLRIVGRASPEIRRLSGCEGIVIVGAVERIEDELAKAHAVVVPLRIGSGTRLKILEAWAHGIPVVSTTVGAEGLPVAHAENLLIADAAPALAKACVRVLTDESLRTRLAEAGRRTVESRFDWADIRAHLLAVIRAELDGQRRGETLPANASSAPHA